MKTFSDEFLADVITDDARQAARYLCSAFVWGDSPQDHDAWAAVEAALLEIARAAEARSNKNGGTA